MSSDGSFCTSSITVIRPGSSIISSNRPGSLSRLVKVRASKRSMTKALVNVASTRVVLQVALGPNRKKDFFDKSDGFKDALMHYVPHISC